MEILTEHTRRQFFNNVIAWRRSRIERPMRGRKCVQQWADPVVASSKKIGVPGHLAVRVRGDSLKCCLVGSYQSNVGDLSCRRNVVENRLHRPRLT